MVIMILGSGCDKCQRLEAEARVAVAELGIDAEFDEVTDPAEIASWGVLSTPALVVDDDVVVVGRVPSADDIMAILSAR